MQRTTLLLAVGLLLSLPCRSASPDGGDRPFRAKPVLGAKVRIHSIHCYNLTCPESPDGKWLLLFRSKTKDAHVGEVCVLSRKTGELRVLAAGVEVQDAHRVACQQWARGGRTVVYQDLRDATSVVVAVDVDSGEEKILGRERQLGWAPAGSESAVLYGEHWAPARYGDIELVDIATGESRTLVSADSVKEAYAGTRHADALEAKFAGRIVTLFFPNLSPDRRRLFFKLSSPHGGGFRDRAGGSDRAGIFFFDLASGKYLSLHARWGHPAWSPDSRRIVNMWPQGAVLIDATTGVVEKTLAQPEYLRPGGHPSFSPDGRRFVADGVMRSSDAGARRWGVVLGDFERGRWTLIHEFDNSRGTRSWRVSHPHPVFSRDGRRVYYNVSSDEFSRLFVAEIRSELAGD